MQVWGPRETEEGTGTAGWRPQPLSAPSTHLSTHLSTPLFLGCHPAAKRGQGQGKAPWLEEAPICRPPPLSPPRPCPNPEGDTVKVWFSLQEVTFSDNY